MSVRNLVDRHRSRSESPRRRDYDDDRELLDDRMMGDRTGHRGSYGRDEKFRRQNDDYDDPYYENRYGNSDHQHRDWGDSYGRGRKPYSSGMTSNSFVEKVRRAFRIVLRESLGNGSIREKNIFGKERMRDGKRIAMQRIGLQFSNSKGHSDRCVTYAAFRRSLPNLLTVVKGGGDFTGGDISDRDFEDLVNAIDTDADQKISYGELMSFISFESKELRDIVRRLARSIRAQGSDFSKTFSRLTSVNGSQFVSVQKLRDMIGHNLLTDLSDEETSTLMKWFDADGNGSVDLSEFRSFLSDYAGNLSRLRLRDDVMAITDLQISSSVEEERLLRSRGFEQVKGGSLNHGSLGKRLHLWVQKCDLSTQIRAIQNAGKGKSGFSNQDKPLLPIVDIRVHGMRRSASLYADGYDCLDVSVNAGLMHVGATNMYIWYKRMSPLSERDRRENYDVAPILDLHITTGRVRNLDSKLYELPSGGYMRVDCNFNHGGILGRTVFLWYKKSAYNHMSSAKKDQEFSRRTSVANLSRAEALRAENALMSYSNSNNESNHRKTSLTMNFQLQRMMHKVYDRARLAVRTYGIDENTGELRDPAKFFEEHSRLALHQSIVGVEPSRKYRKRIRFRGFCRAMRRAGVAINDKHMRLLMQQIDHDNDGYIEANDFTAFTHFSGHHLQELLLALRSTILSSISRRFDITKAEREDRQYGRYEKNKNFKSSEVFSADLEMIYDKYRGADPVLKCRGLNLMLARIIGVHLTHEESERLMGMMNHRNDRMEDVLPANLEHPHPGTESSAVAAHQAAKRGFTRDNWLEFMEKGIHPNAPEGPGHRLASAACLLQEYLRHVAVSRMTVLRKQKRSQLSRAANASGGAAALAVKANSGVVTGTPAQIQATILQSGADAAWRSLDPKNYPAVSKDSKRSIMHLQTALGTASTWKGTGGMTTLSLKELLNLAYIIEPQAEHVKDFHFDDKVGNRLPSDMSGSSTSQQVDEATIDAINRTPAALAATRAFSFEAMCRFAGIGSGSTVPISKVIVTRSAAEEHAAFSNGYWRANFNKAVIDPEACRFKQNVKNRQSFGHGRFDNSVQQFPGQDATGAVQIWFAREAGMPTVKDIRITNRAFKKLNDRGMGEWRQADSPLDARRGIYLNYLTDIDYDSRNSATDMSLDNEDAFDHFLVSVSAASAFPGRVLGHSALLEGVSTTYVFEKVPGSEYLRSEHISLWRARSRQTNAIYCLKEHNAAGFKVGDHVYVKRTGFLNTGDGTILSNQHRGETEGQIVMILLPGNAGNNVKPSSVRKATYDVRNSITGGLLKGVKEHLLRHADDKFKEVESVAMTSTNPNAKSRRVRYRKSYNSQNLIERVRDYIRETSRVASDSRQREYVSEGDSDSDGDHIYSERKAQHGPGKAKFDLISCYNRFVLGRSNIQEQHSKDFDFGSTKNKSILVEKLYNKTQFKSLLPLRSATAKECQDVAIAFDVNGDGVIDFDDFRDFVGLSVHQLTFPRRRKGPSQHINVRHRIGKARLSHSSDRYFAREYTEYSDDDVDTEEDWKYINYEARRPKYKTGPFIEDKDPLLSGVSALTLALRREAKHNKTDLDFEIRQWIEHIRSIERSGKGLSSEAVLVEAGSKLDAVLNKNEVREIVEDCIKWSSKSSKWPKWSHLRRLVLKYRGQGGINEESGYTRRLRRLFATMRRVIQRMRDNGTDFYQVCEKYDPGYRGFLDMKSFKNICSECGFGLNRKDFVLLKRIIGVRSDGTQGVRGSQLNDVTAIDYEALNRVLQPSWDRSDQSLQTLLNDVGNYGYRKVRPQFGTQSQRQITLERRLQAALAAGTNQRQSLQLMFSRYDRNGEGLITPENFINVCNIELGLSLNDDDANLLVVAYTARGATPGAFSKRRQNMVDYQKFCESMRLAVDTDPTFLQRILRNAFARARSRGIVPQQLFVEADRNGSGRLSRRAFRKVLTGSLSVEFSNEEKFVALMDKFDIAMDGFVDYVAFCRFASPDRSNSDVFARRNQGSIIDPSAFSRRLQRKIRELALYTNASSLDQKFHFDLRMPFERFDVARSGYINRNDFKKVLAHTGIAVSNGEMAYLRDRFSGKSGGINYISFCKFAKCDEQEFDTLSKRVAARFDTIMQEGKYLVISRT